MKGLALLAAAVFAVFEPIVAIDPDFPDRIAAGAQLGEGYNRGGLRFVTWTTSDGGRNWSPQEVALRELARAPTMAADLSLAFGLEGELYGFGISGDGLRDRVPEAALALAVSRDGGRSFTPRSLLGETLDHADGSFSASDKPWIAIDRGSESFTSGEVSISPGAGFACASCRAATTSSGISSSRSPRDSGRTYSEPLPIARAGGGAQIAVRPGGLVDLVWLEEGEDRSD